MEQQSTQPQAEEVKAPVITGDETLDQSVQDIADLEKARKEQEAFTKKFDQNINIIRKNLKAKYSMNELSRQLALALVENNYIKEMAKQQDAEVQRLTGLVKELTSKLAGQDPSPKTEEVKG